MLGPQLFTLYTSPLGDVIRSYISVQHHMYADDTQLYLTLAPDDPTKGIATMEKCIDEIKVWMTRNKLKLNDTKTEVLDITSKWRPGIIKELKVGESLVETVASARNLGAIMDRHLSMEAHVNNLCRCATYSIYQISKMRNILDRPSTERLIHAFVSSKLDHLNSLLYGLPDEQLNKLQRIQNTAARVICRARKYDSITPVLYDLHWLPVKQRIHYKILLLTYLTINGLAPPYMNDLIQKYHPSRSLRSGSLDQLHMPRFKLQTFGKRAFSIAAPALWNSLPIHLRKAPSVGYFKKHLKTLLFTGAFSSQ